MGREIMRVALDFQWPINKTWQGYLMPDRLSEKPCPDCELGMTPEAHHLYDQYYGNAPFDPAETGSTPVTRDHPAIRAAAERQFEHSREFYMDYHGYTAEMQEIVRAFGEDPLEQAIQDEGDRLAALCNARWACHLSQADVDGLIASERGLKIENVTHEWKRHETGPGGGWVPIEGAPELTAELVNNLQVRNSWRNGVGVYATVIQRCEREGIRFDCPTCEGHASLERYEGQRAEAEQWEREDPPKGEGWQLWETVSEGSPISPVFPDAEGLARWMTTPAVCWGAVKEPYTIEQARAFIGAGWAPTMVSTPGKGLQDGVVFVADNAIEKGDDQ